MKNFKGEIKNTKVLTTTSLVRKMAKESGLSEEEAYRTLDSLLDIIKNEVSEGRDLVINDFGVFRRRLRKGFYRKMFDKYFDDTFKFSFRPFPSLNDKINRSIKLDNILKSFRKDGNI